MKRADIYRLIDVERLRQQAKFGDASIAGDRINNDKRVAIMTEELGEVAKAADELANRGGSCADELRAELVQIAACAVGWLERWTEAQPPHQPDAAPSDWTEIPTEQDIRYALWLGHGHGITGLYGDDGEMQCSACPPPAQDYKRAPLSMLVRTALTALRAAPASPAVAAWRALSDAQRAGAIALIGNLYSAWLHDALVAAVDLLRSLAPEAGDDR